MNKSKKIIILDNEGGRLGNQLWNYVSVYAYCLEKNYTCHNYAFWRYTKNFDMTSWNICMDALLSRMPKRASEKIYKAIVSYIKTKKIDQIIFSGNHIYIDTETPFYLPPSPYAQIQHENMLKDKELSDHKEIYFSGWLFRNPVGIMKYHSKIASLMRPKKSIERETDLFIKSVRMQAPFVVGVHIRKGDYKTYDSGRFYFTEEEVASILHDYLAYSKRSKDGTIFIICSDDKIETSHFGDLKVKLGIGKTEHDLFTLSKTDLIIGSDSTFGTIAAYFGNIPIILFKKNDIDWKSALEHTSFNYYNGSENIQH